VLGDVEEYLAPLVGHFVDPAQIDGDLDEGRSIQANQEALLVLVCQSPPGDQVGPGTRLADPLDHGHVRMLARRVVILKPKRGRRFLSGGATHLPLQVGAAGDDHGEERLPRGTR
jgi:hypothetical protein